MPPRPTPQLTLLSDTAAPAARQQPRNGLTAEERARPTPQSSELLQLEREQAAAAPEQLGLFAPGPGGSFKPLLGGLTPLEGSSSLELARAWYRHELQQAKRPRNTIESYCYDLAALEKKIGAKPINAITRKDIASFLQDASGRSTRKRHLTSLRRFFRFLIDDARVMHADPTEGFYPHVIPLRTPVPLFAEERAALLTAAAADQDRWSRPAVWLMLCLGLGRGELLALHREHIDLADPLAPVVYIFYDDATKRGKERKLAADAEFAGIYATYLEEASPTDLLFPQGPASVNTMVDRVREAAGIVKAVTPQTLRHSFAVERALDGASEDDLLAVLGLADDPRNRASVRRYLKLAETPL